jgi:phosphate transport system substrate-binding protein
MIARRLAYTVLLIALGSLLLASPGLAADKVKLQGSGASFPFPLYGRWFKTYSKNHKNVTIDYQAKGSGAGIKDFMNRTVDFAASDAAMTDEQMAAVTAGVQLLPVTAGEIVLAYNLPKGPQELKLSREAYPKIFLGEITKWNDPLIAAANPGVPLPDQEITIVRRADSSGTTYVFTQHLSTISEAWKNGPGTGTTVNWASSDKFIAAPKNDGITATIKQTPGSIGYIEYGFAKLTKLPMASLENQAGKFVKPSLESGQAALANVEMPPDLRAWLPDPEGEGAYPIVTYTWLLFYKKYDDPAKAAAIRDVVEYVLTEGQKISDKMGYIPLPDNVVQVVNEAAKSIQ